MVGMIFVRKIIHLATKIFGSTNFNLGDDVVFFVPWLLPVTVPVGSPFLYVVVRNRKEIGEIWDRGVIQKGSLF